MKAGALCRIIQLYEQGISIRKIPVYIENKYRREKIRQELKSAGVRIRGKITVYPSLSEFNDHELVLLAELLGCFYGDGHVHKNKDPSHGIYDAFLTFASNEKDLIKRAISLTENLFKFTPKVMKKTGYSKLKFRRTFAKYLFNLGYPIGKKSVVNPKLPMQLLNTKTKKAAFIRGFFNAEASINETVFVQQSVRIILPQHIVQELKSVGKKTHIKKIECYFVRWSKASSILNSKYQSNVLIDLRSLLRCFKIKSVIYPVRIYIGREDKTSIHFELRIPRKFIKMLVWHNLITCKKKLYKIESLTQE